MPAHQNSPNQPSVPAAAEGRAVRKPVRSMTGYAHRTADTPLGRVTIELRSVNFRFVDLQFRLADDLRSLEPLLREQIAASVSRGKVECRLQLRSLETGAGGIRMDEQLIGALAQADARVRQLAPQAAPLSVADYLRLQATASAAGGSGTAAASEGASADDADPLPERLWPVLQSLVQQALTEFVASREREGARLATTIIGQVEDMKSVVTGLEPLIPELLANAQTRLLTRLQEAMPQAASTIAPEETFARIRQEVALMNLRGDVTEEFDRLKIHFTEVLRALDQGGAVGKRLDFLTQELNREANTIASKSGGVDVTNGAVALKLLIEQMREQVQNIE